MYELIPISQDMSGKVAALIARHWGSNIVVTKGKVHQAEKLQGFVAMADGEIKGLITFNIAGDECEIVSLDSLVENQGLGTSLIQKVVDVSREHRCRRVWLITTNDNTKAIRFYQKRGFNMAGLYLNAINESRKIKPEIPLYGFDDIPILHEIEFEIIL